MLTILIVIISLSLLILGHEAGHFFAAKILRLRVDEFGFGFPPKIFERKKGETEYSLNWLPFGGFVRIAGEIDRARGDLDKLESAPQEEKKKLFLYRPAWQRSFVILSGVLINFIIGWILLSAILMIGTPQVLIISEVQKNSPAAEAGILPGDLVENFKSANQFVSYINVNRGKEIEVRVLRAGEGLTLKATPRTEGEGALGVFLAEGGIPKTGFFKSLYEGFKRTWQIAWLTLGAFGDLLKSLIIHGRLLEGVVGPLGIFGVATETSKIGYIYLFQLISLISINLAVLNLLPFPALDGGRFFLIILEKIKGSPISPKVEGIINGIGFAFLIVLMILITTRDIVRLF